MTAAKEWVSLEHITDVWKFQENVQEQEDYLVIYNDKSMDVRTGWSLDRWIDLCPLMQDPGFPRWASLIIKPTEG